MARSTRKKFRDYLKKCTAALKKENNESAHKKLRIKQGQWGCPVCPPWRGENSMGKKHGKHGKTKPKYKNKRS